MDDDAELVADRAEKHAAAFRGAVVELSERVTDTFETPRARVLELGVRYHSG